MNIKSNLKTFAFVVMTVATAMTGFDHRRRTKQNNKICL
jgi:hypothetical protein